MKILGYETHPAADVFPLIMGAAFDEFCESFHKHGFLDGKEIVLDVTRRVLDGRNRLRACEATGVEPKFKTFAGKSAVEFVIAENLHRRHLDESQRAMVGAELLPIAEAEARERQVATLKQNTPADSAAGTTGELFGAAPCVQICTHGDKQTTPPARHLAAALSTPQHSPETDSHKATARRAADDVAKAVNVSPRSVASAKKVKERGADEVVQSVKAGKLAVSDAAAIVDKPVEVQREAVRRVESGESRTVKEAVRKVEKEAVRDAIVAEPAPLPVGPFRVIAIDPPWKYDNRAEDASHRGRNPYPDMTVDEIAALPVAALAHEDCVLWLWTTNAFMRDAYRLLDAWGFHEKTILTWDKELLGLGDWLRNVTEHCILAVRGRPTVMLTNQTTIIREARREHSRKPDAFYRLVESLCPGSKLEMFARAPRDGWAVWGAEAEKFDAA